MHFLKKTQYLHQVYVSIFIVCLGQPTSAKFSNTLGCFLGPKSEASLVQALFNIWLYVCLRWYVIFLGSGRSQEVNPGRTRKSREKRGHHDVPPVSEECTAPGRHPTPSEVCRGRGRAHQPPCHHHTPEIRCPFHNWWGKFPESICNIHRRKRRLSKLESNAKFSEVSLFSPAN